MHIHQPDMPIKYLAYMPNSVNRFASGTYLAITGEVQFVVGCVVGYKCENAGFIFPYVLLAVCLFGM